MCVIMNAVHTFLEVHHIFGRGLFLAAEDPDERQQGRSASLPNKMLTDFELVALWIDNL
jgi:hypothetical protein